MKKKSDSNSLKKKSIKSKKPEIPSEYTHSKTPNKSEILKEKMETGISKIISLKKFNKFNNKVEKPSHKVIEFNRSNNPSS